MTQAHLLSDSRIRGIYITLSQHGFDCKVDERGGDLIITKPSAHFLNCVAKLDIEVPLLNDLEFAIWKDEHVKYEETFYLRCRSFLYAHKNANIKENNEDFITGYVNSNISFGRFNCTNILPEYVEWGVFISESITYEFLENNLLELVRSRDTARKAVEICLERGYPRS